MFSQNTHVTKLVRTRSVQTVSSSSAEIDPCLQCLLSHSPGDPSPCAGQAHQTNDSHRPDKHISCPIVNERKLRQTPTEHTAHFPDKGSSPLPSHSTNSPQLFNWLHRFDVTPCPALLPSSLSPNHLPKCPLGVARQCPKCSLQTLLMMCPEQPTPKLPRHIKSARASLKLVLCAISKLLFPAFAVWKQNLDSP